jgi:hypothetical protein
MPEPDQTQNTGSAPADGSQVDSTEGAADAGAIEEPSGTGGDAAAAGAAGEGDQGTDQQGDAAEGQQPKQNIPEEPPERKAFFIGMRKGKQQARQQQGDAQQGGNDPYAEYDPNDLEVVDQRVQEHIQPYAEQLQQQQVERDVEDFVQQNPEFQPYKDTVRNWAMHESRKNLPVSSIFYEVAGQDLLNIGAQRARSSDAQKMETGGSSGHSTRNEPAAKNPSEMTSAEFEQYKEDVRRGRV